MATQIGKIYYDLDVNTGKFKSNLTGAGAHADKVGKNTHMSMTKMAGGVMLGTLATQGLQAGWRAMTGFLGSSVTAFNEAERADAQLNAVLESTKGVSGMTAESISKMASELQSMTGVSDEAVKGASSMLLTFTNLRKDEFKPATQAVLDMATAMNGGLIPSEEQMRKQTIMVGKALQDPIKGITALRKVGVNFSDAQRDVIKKMVETGDVAGAQRLILKELSVEFGGSAVKAGKTFAGQMGIAKASIGDLQETLGGFIMSGTKPLVQAFNNMMQGMGGVDQVILNLQKGFKKAGDTLSTVAKKVGDYLLPKLKALWETVSKDLIPALAKLYDKILKPLLPIIGTLLVVAVGLLIDAFNTLYSILSPLINFLADNSYIVWALAGAFVAVKTAMFLTTVIDTMVMGFRTLTLQVIPSLITQLKALELSSNTALGVLGVVAVIAYKLINDAGKETIKQLDETQKAISSADKQYDTIVKNLKKDVKLGKIDDKQYKKTMRQLAEINSEIVPTQSKWEQITEGFNRGLKIAFENINDSSVSQWIVGLREDILKWFSNAPNWLIDTGKKLIEGFVKGNIEAGGKIWGTLSSVFSAIGRFFSGVATWLADAGRNLVWGFINGLYNVGNGLWGHLSNIFASIGRFFRGAGNWLWDTGRNIVWGLINGMGSLAGAIGSWFLDRLPSWIKTPFKKALGIRSPSTVFSGYGKQIVAGLVQGVEGGMGNVQTAIDGLAGVTMQPQYSMQGAGTTNNETKATFTGNIMLGDSDAVDEFFNRLNRNGELARKGMTNL